MLRRNFLISSSFLALANCAINSVNGVTTVTVNLATINSYAQAIENGVSILMGIPLISAALGLKGALISGAVSAFASAAASLNTTYSGQTSFSFTVKSIPAALTAMEADSQNILNLFETVISASKLKLPSNASTTLSAIQTIVSLIAALVSFLPMATQTPMTEEQALAVLNVK